ARSEGPVRVAKTVARRTLGLDQRFAELLSDRLGITGLTDPIPLCMDACQLGLGDDTVDVAFSRCLFEHLDDPARATTELARVLRPGGVMYLAINPFTGPLGAHDPDIMSASVPMDWAHVQAQPDRHSTSNAFLNRWRLADYEEMFTELLPGSTVELWWPADAELEARLDVLLDAGELDGVDREELLARELIVVWRK
ncbi:MAG: class I SAM-dependent methyltransferase, partial [Acidimicrobiales bacterium]